ncbi:MAG: hypothetical protein ACAI34_05550 [Verrucomicrobium sp.]
MPISSFRLFGVLTLAVVFSSCSLPFHHDWRRAARTDAQNPPKDLTGAWEGTWRSEKSSHHGKLKAIVTKVATTKEKVDYDFRYHATWAKVLSGGYTTHHSVAPDGTVTGEHDLGKLLGGVYRYKGKASPTHFRATYECNLDNGVFELQRPSPAGTSLSASAPAPASSAR